MPSARLLCSPLHPGPRNGASAVIAFILSLGAACFAPPAASTETGPPPIDFQAARSYLTGNDPVSIVVADWNRDGIPDVAVASQGCPNCVPAVSGSVSIHLGAADGSLGLPTHYPAGAVPTSMASADLNRDGEPDLAVLERDPARVHVLLGSSSGTFRTTPGLDTGSSSASALAIADLDQDQLLDLAIARSGSDELVVLRGRGDGTFFPGSALPVGANPVSVVTADLDGDGREELIAANRNAATLSILRNQGGGAFVTVASPTTLPNPVFVAAADLDGNGLPDLVVAHEGISQLGYTNGSVTVRLASAVGLFQPPVEHVTGGRPRALLIGDFTGDGRLDIAVASEGSSLRGFQDAWMLLLTGTGDGKFQAGPRYGSGGRPRFLAAGDLNRDGHQDMVAANIGSDSITVFSGEGAGRFRGPSFDAVRTAARASVTADFNLDGIPDLVTGGNLTFTTLLGKGDLSFTTVTSPAPIMGSMVVGFFNADPYPDLAGAQSESGNVTIALARGDGRFQVTVPYPTGAHPHGIVAGDFNADGLTDVGVALEPSFGGLAVFLCAGRGVFRSPIFTAVDADISGMTAADFNRDGRVDLAYGDPEHGGDGRGHTLRVLLGRGDGTFAPGRVYPVPSLISTLRSADLNADSRTDILVANQHDASLSVFLGNGDGTFQSPARYPTGKFPQSIVVADLNHDGRLDLAVGNSGSANIAMFEGLGDGTFRSRSHYGAGTFLHGVSASDFDLDGRVDLLAGGSILLNAAPPRQPLLRAVIKGDRLRLTWPRPAIPLRLETAADLAPPAWVPAPVPPTLAGDRFELLMPVDAPARYFRLRDPVAPLSP